MRDTPARYAATRLRDQKARVLDVWEQRVRAHLAAAKETDRVALLDSLPRVVDEVADALQAPPADRESGDHQKSLALEHGQQRAELSSYSLEQVIVELQLLRRVLLDILEEGGQLDDAAREVIAETILNAVRNAAGAFARRRHAEAIATHKQTDIRFRHMVEAVKDYAIFTMDPAGVITSWNEGCIRMKLYTVDDAIGQHFSQLYPVEGKRRDEPMCHLRSAAIEGRFRGEGVRIRKNGEPFLADVCITPIFDEGILTGFTKVVQDLTERNALIQERDLSRSDSLALRAQAEYRERFVATLTHDLRSPLAAARTAAELISRFPEDGEKVRQWASRSAEQLQHADRMIGDLLDASRLHAGQPLALAFEQCDVGTIAAQVCEELASRYGDRFTVQVDGYTIGYWNNDGLRRILDNLLTNAVKYGDADKPITVRLHQVEDRMLIAVHNFGTIIPSEDQLRLFQPFHRTDAAKASGQPGWGIGLTLVKGVAEAHGGVVKAESYPRDGTTFTVDLPIDARKHSEPSQPLTEERETS